MIRHNQDSVEFTAEDRCDRCQAQAYVLASKGDLELVFCGHHKRRFSEALLLDEWVFSYDYGGLEKLANNRIAEPVPN